MVILGGRGRRGVDRTSGSVDNGMTVVISILGPVEEFLTNGVYQVVSAPSEVHSESEDNAIDVRVIVRRVPPPQAKLYNQ